MLSPRLSWRDLGQCLGISERTIVRRVGPLFADGTLRSTAIRNPYAHPDLVPLVLRVQCNPTQARALAMALTRRGDTNWVEIVGGGHEVCSTHFVKNVDERDRLLLDQLPATRGVDTWRAYEVIRTFASPFSWTGGHLTDDEVSALPSVPDLGPVPIQFRDHDEAIIASLIENGRVTLNELAARARISTVTARRRIDDLTSSGVIRLATEVDLRLLGVRTEALVWLQVEPSRLENIGTALAEHAQVRFAAATTGHTNLLIAVALRDRRSLYNFLTKSLGALIGGGTVDVSPILVTAKRTGLAREANGGHL